MMIKRQLESEIHRKLYKSPAIAILGPQKSGKTTLSKRLKTNSKAIVYLDAQNPDDQSKLMDLAVYLSRFQNSLVVIDGVHSMPAIFTNILPLIDANRIAGRFVLLSAVAPHLLKGVPENLSDYITYAELSPIGLKELPEDIYDEQHWFRGGFPESLLAISNEGSMDWLNSFIKKYADQDLAVLFGVNLSVVTLRNFWSMLGYSNGNLLNFEIFARSLGVSTTTVVKYLDFLEGGYLVRRLQPWLVNAKRRLVKSPKVYIRDAGILHRLLNISSFDSLFGHPIAGSSWEGYVIEQIYQCLPADIEIYFYRTQAGAECDVVLVEGAVPLACIDIKLSNLPAVSKGFMSCVIDIQPKHTFMITPQSDTYVNKDGVMVMNLKEFLEKKLINL